MPLNLTRDEARRFLVRRHLLAPPRSLPAKPESVLDVIDRLGFLQFDPLEVPGARNHDLMLHARIGGYRREWLDRWLYGPDRRLIELYNKSLNIVPLSELAHYRITWDRNAPGLDEGILRDQAAVAEAVLSRIAAEGPLSTAAFADHNHAIDWWWAPTRAARAVMEALFVAGRLGIARREGNRRYYDLIERLVPAEVREVRETHDDAMRHKLLSRYRASGLAGPSSGAELMYGSGSAAQKARHTGELVEQRLLLEVRVEGLKGARYILADEAPMLEAGGEVAPSVAFIAPVDPLVADRRNTLTLWDFDYRWEIFVPAKKRRWGYYVLPILFGDRFVGRIEPRFERREGVLRIIGMSWETGFSPRRERGFRAALLQALSDYSAFVGAKRVDWQVAQP
ncbi:crosslink repair DNA glycosylase YcaQ family protein [soil metagenome]